jgi:ML domain
VLFGDARTCAVVLSFDMPLLGEFTHNGGYGQRRTFEFVLLVILLPAARGAAPQKDSVRSMHLAQHSALVPASWRSCSGPSGKLHIGRTLHAEAVMYSCTFVTHNHGCAAATPSTHARTAALQMSGVDLAPSSVLPPGGELLLTLTATLREPATAGSARVDVFYWGVPVLSASDSMCSGNAAAIAHDGARDNDNMDAGGTCTLPAGAVTLTHAATLPAIAPRGRYSMRLSASDAVTGAELMCVDVWFRIA